MALGAAEGTRNLGLGLGLWLFLCALTLWFSGPPALEPEPGARSAFSSQRALAHVNALSREPGQTGSQGNARRRQYIIERLAALGIGAEVQATDSVVSMLGRVVAARVNNVLARIPGQQRGHAILLSAHYDTVPNSPGASDDAAGVATLLETARLLREGPRLERDVLLLFTDGEELGLLGAEAFVREHPWRHEVALALNFEARGSRGASAMYETSLPNAGLIAAFAEAVPWPVGNSLISSLSRALPNDTDFTIFRRAGIGGYAFAFADGFTRYHRSTDDAQHLDPRSLAHHGSYAASLARALANHDLPSQGLSVVYFEVLGRWVFRYPEWLAKALGTGTLLGLLLVLRQAQTRGWARLTGVSRGVLVALACLATAMVTAAVLDALLGLTLPKDRRVDWAALLFPAHLAGALWCCGLVQRRALGRATREELLLGALAVGAGLAFGFGWWLPGASYAPQWLTLSALVGWWFARRQAGSESQQARVMAVALLPSAFFVGSVGYAFYVLMGTQLPPVAALPVGWAAALLLPWYAPVWLPRAKPLTIALTTSAALVLLAASVAGRFVPAAPTFTDLTYVVDADQQQARLAASVGTEHEAINRTLTGAQRIEYIPGKFTLAVAAPRVPLPSSKLSVISAKPRDGGRELSLAIEPEPGVRCVSLLELGRGGTLRSATVNGKRPQPNVRFGPEIDKKLWYIVTGEELGDGFNITYCGFSGETLRLDLWVEARPLQVRVIDVMDGLPSVARPHWAPQQMLYFDLNGDRSITKRDLTL